MNLHPPAAGEHWVARLSRGDADAAWDDFLAEFRPLLFSVIGSLVSDPETRMDAFVAVCDGLRADDLKRLRAFQPGGPAKFSTWLVSVCRNLVIDWYRATHGRRRLDPALAQLSPAHQRLYELLTRRRLSFIEAFEVLRSTEEWRGSYREFLALVRELHRTVTQQAGALARDLIGVDPAFELALEAEAAPDVADHERVMKALEQYPADVRLATLLFVVDELPADEVARMVGWSGRKTVYNRVYRTLEAIRQELGEP